jgi:hypothetical protein
MHGKEECPKSNVQRAILCFCGFSGQKKISPDAQNALKRGIFKEQFCVSVISVAKQKHSHRMHGMHGKEECPKSNSVFFCVFSRQTKRLSPNARNARKRGMSKEQFCVLLCLQWANKKTLTECSEYTEKRDVQIEIPCFL